MFQILLSNNLKEKRKGYILLDVILAVSVISIALVVLLNTVGSALNLSNSNKKILQADALIREELEALRAYRDGTTWGPNLGAVSTGVAYHLFLDTSANPVKWNLVQGSETVDGFTRQLVFDNVSRDTSTHDIQATYNPVNRDANTLKATATVSITGKTWQVVTYLTNWNR
jgi:type II secretory pathway pseudopilin PulG